MSNRVRDDRLAAHDDLFVPKYPSKKYHHAIKTCSWIRKLGRLEENINMWRSVQWSGCVVIRGSLRIIIPWSAVIFGFFCAVLCTSLDQKLNRLHRSVHSTDCSTVCLSAFFFSIFIFPRHTLSRKDELKDLLVIGESQAERSRASVSQFTACGECSGWDTVKDSVTNGESAVLNHLQAKLFSTDYLHCANKDLTDLMQPSLFCGRCQVTK